MEQLAIEATVKPAEDTLLAARVAAKQRSRSARKADMAAIERWFAVRDAAGKPIATLGMRGSLGVAELSNLWVAEPARGTGIGRRLIEAAEAEARSARVAHLLVRAHAFDASDFFQHLGYRQIGALSTGEDAIGIRWLTKPLSESAVAAEATAATPDPAQAPATLPATETQTKTATKKPGKFARTRRRR